MWHIVLTVLTVLLILMVIGFGSGAAGDRFRAFSMATIATLVVSGAWAGMDGARMAADLPTPWMGVKERVNIYGYMLWLAVLAVVLLRRAARR